ncbi:MAG: MFS transporter [Clostridiales bacterium]|nr:MFS transporter [Clostridiales bacterium]
MKKNYTYTIYACYVGYIVQAIINNLAPLLFLTFQESYGVSMERIGLLITVNFGVQIAVDLIAAKYVDRIGYRSAIVAAHIFSTMGLIAMGFLPRYMDSPYAGLVLAMVCNAIGGGLIEVLISPIVEAAPSSNAKEAAMSLLHSFYCWGHVGVVLLSTLGFRLLGMERWYYLPILWSIVPALNSLVFLRVPIAVLVEGGEKIPAKRLLSTGAFWLFFALMLCAGASEQAMSQWASLFAEKGLNQTKTVGDLLGPCLFAVLMGASRMYYGRFGDKIDLRRFMTGSAVLCIGSYLLAILMQNPLLALMGCALCGLSVGIMWPGTFSLAAKGCPQGGTLMFGLLALAGDVGCAAGPGVVGVISGIRPEYGIKAGLAAAIVFPCAMLVMLRGMLRGREKQEIV